MKKTILGTAIGFCAAAAVIFISCSKGVDCTALVSDVQSKGTAYVNATDPAVRKQACKDYVAAMEKFLAAKKCYTSDPTAKATYEQAIAAIKSDCQ